jgi:hypothetical protein
MAPEVNRPISIRNGLSFNTTLLALFVSALSES